MSTQKFGYTLLFGPSEMALWSTPVRILKERRGYWRKLLKREELLAFKRVQLVSEAGSGRTCECRARQQELLNEGEAAFFLIWVLATALTTQMGWGKRSHSP